MYDINFISTLVKRQFPEFYNEQGTNFVAFVQAYYEWMEQQGELIQETRSLRDFRDIDTTTERFLADFKSKYMNQLPVELIGNQRLFQKHILELYRSKGSLAGLRLLFRLLYNEDVDVYLPHEDIFKLSDGTWIQPKYFEVTPSVGVSKYLYRVVTGTSTGSTAVVENVERKVVNGIETYVISLSNISGSFAVGEMLTADGVTVIDASTIKGSPTELRSITSTAGFKVGDIVEDISVEGAQKRLKGVVSEVYDSVGIIDFQIVDGGDYYSLDAEVNITPGTNTSGIGADFRVFSLANTSLFQYSTDIIQTYANVAINASTYGFPSNLLANSVTIIQNAINIESVTVGTIASLAVLNPGTGYDGSVNVEVIDPYTSTRGIHLVDGFGGMNADIIGNSLLGTGLIGAMKVYDSGLTYNTDKLIIPLFNTANTAMTSLTEIRLGGVGWSEGYFDNNDGFASDTKYLFDGHYYQDYSYVVKTSKQLDDFVNILKSTVHTAGNAVYSITTIRSTQLDNIQHDFAELISSPS